MIPETQGFGILRRVLNCAKMVRDLFFHFENEFFVVLSINDVFPKNCQTEIFGSFIALSIFQTHSPIRKTENLKNKKHSSFFECLTIYKQLNINESQ